MKKKYSIFALIKNSLSYLVKKGTSEWLNQCTIDIYSILQEKNKGQDLIEILQSDKNLVSASKDIAKLLAV